MYLCNFVKDKIVRRGRGRGRWKKMEDRDFFYQSTGLYVHHYNIKCINTSPHVNIMGKYLTSSLSLIPCTTPHRIPTHISRSLILPDADRNPKPKWQIHCSSWTEVWSFPGFRRKQLTSCQWLGYSYLQLHRRSYSGWGTFNFQSSWAQNFHESICTSDSLSWAYTHHQRWARSSVGA